MDWLSMLFGGMQGMPNPGMSGMMGNKPAFNYGEQFGPAMPGVPEMYGPGMASLFGKDVPMAGSQPDPAKLMQLGMGMINQEKPQQEDQAMRSPGAFGARFPQMAFMKNSPMAMAGQNPYAQVPQIPRRKTGIFGG